MLTRDQLIELFSIAEEIVVDDPALAAMHVTDIAEEIEALRDLLAGPVEDAETLCAHLGVKLLHVNDHWRALRQMCGDEALWQEMEEIRPDEQ